MQKISFIDIPQQYKNLQNSISDPALQNIFSKFKIIYLSFKECDNELLYTKYVSKYLKNYKFITYDINQIDINQSSSKKIQFKGLHERITNNNNNICNFICCIEKECLIIENISISNIYRITDELYLNKISLVNACTSSIFIHKFLSQNEKDIKEEVLHFAEKFQNEIENN